jgi:hypothetical protein
MNNTGTKDTYLNNAYSKWSPYEKMNVTVNGQTLLPNTGSNSPAKKSMYLTATIGNVLMPTGANDGTNAVANTQFGSIYDANLINLLQKMSYFGVQVNRKVDRIEINLQQSSTTLVPTAAGVLYVHGVVEKFFVMSKGKVTVGFV